MPTIADLGTEIVLPQLPLRASGLFTDVVPQINVEAQGSDRVGFGAKWMIRDPYDILIDTIADCDVDDSLVTEEIDLTETSTLPFSYANLLRCSTIGGLDMADINAMLDDDVAATRSFAFAAAATTQISVDHLNLADDSTAVTGGDIVEAMGFIEDGLGDRIANLRGYIFVPLTLLSAAFAANLIREEGGRFLSPAGHLVIADAGHGAQDTLYGTGAMAWALSPPVPVTGGDGWFDRGRNRLNGVRQRLGLIAFNPLHSVRSTVV